MTTSAAAARATGRLGEALAAGRAATGAWAFVGSDAQARPGGARGLEVELGPVTARGRSCPCHKTPDLFANTPGSDRSRCAARPSCTRGIGRIGAGRPDGLLPLRQLGVKRRIQTLLVAEALELQEALAAEVVRAAFEHCPAHRSLEATGHEREVLVGELVLQSLCRRGHDDALGREHSRNEIGERLACTRAGGHGDIASGGECLGDRLGHLELAGPKLAGRKRRHDALQQLGDFGFGHMRTLPEPSALARPRAQAFARPRKMLPPRNTMTTSGRTTTARSLW